MWKTTIFPPKWKLQYNRRTQWILNEMREYSVINVEGHGSTQQVTTSVQQDDIPVE